MLDANASDELEQLKQSLELVRENYLEKWTGKARQEARENLLQFHLARLAEEQEKINSLEQQIQAKRGECARIVKDQENNEHLIANAETKLTELKVTECTLNHAKNEIIVKRSQVGENTKLREEESATLRQVVETKREHYSKAMKYFLRRLGLDIKKTENDDLRFVFTCIDERNWQKEFTFSIKVDENNAYTVLKCDPHLEEIERFTEELNTTNNFSLFVIKVRNCFKKIATAGSGETKAKEIPEDEATVVGQVLGELTNKIALN